MKKILMIPCLALWILSGSLTVQGQDTVHKIPSLSSSSDSIDYFLGVNMGYSLEGNPYVRNRDLVTEGFIHALEGSASWDATSSRAILMELLTAMQATTSPAENAGSTENLSQGRAFLEENGKREGVITTSSGLQYEAIAQGTGPRPSASSTVEVHYEGTLIDGTVFDSSYKRGESISFPLNRVIRGWTEGVQLMQVGSVYRFFIPSELAYGTRATGSIPSNSVLIFKIELLGIQ
jgi:FKBP-type peptidyl-prolyl cis-trans isomerase FkpA